MNKKLYSLIAFNWLAVSAFAQECNFMCNGNFDDTFITATVGLVSNPTLSCWQTTASDGKMEVWANGYNGVPSYSGIQFLEMNATMPATLYQNIIASPGTVLSISFAHRGRGGIDSMSVSAGPTGGPYTTLGYFGDDQTAWGYYTVNYTVPGPGTAYEVRFTTEYWGAGNPGIGNFLDAVDVCNVTGIDESQNTVSTSIFPNPAQNNATILFDNFKGDNFTLEMFDSQGKKVRTVNNIVTGKIEIGRNDLLKGVYFFQLTSGSKQASGKIIFIE